MSQKNANNAVFPSNNGRWRIDVDQISQDYVNNTSLVQVTGTMFNDGPSAVSASNVERDISGSASFTTGDPLHGGGGGGEIFSFTPANFGFNIAHADNLVVMQHNFTATHSPDGTLTVSFGVHYGTTGTDTFGNNKTASVNLALDRIPKGAYVRHGGTWKFALPYIRVNGKWVLADCYVRSGGTWKLTN